MRTSHSSVADRAAAVAVAAAVALASQARSITPPSPSRCDGATSALSSFPSSGGAGGGGGGGVLLHTENFSFSSAGCKTELGSVCKSTASCASSSGVAGCRSEQSAAASCGPSTMWKLENVSTCSSNHNHHQPDVAPALASSDPTVLESVCESIGDGDAGDGDAGDGDIGDGDDVFQVRGTAPPPADPTPCCIP